MGDKRAEGHALLMKMMKKKKQGSSKLSASETGDSEASETASSLNASLDTSTRAAPAQGGGHVPQDGAAPLVEDMQKKLEIHSRLATAADAMAKVGLNVNGSCKLFFECEFQLYDSVAAPKELASEAKFSRAEQQRLQKVRSQRFIKNNLILRQDVADVSNLGAMTPDKLREKLAALEANTREALAARDEKIAELERSLAARDEKIAELERSLAAALKPKR